MLVHSPIDSHARKQLLEILREFLANRVTNGVVIDGLNLDNDARKYLSSKDPGVRAILAKLTISFDSYANEFYLSEFGQLDSEGSFEFDKICAFLGSDQSYEWPDGQRCGVLVKLFAGID